MRTYVREHNRIPDGPYLPTSIEMLDVVRDKIPKSEVICFSKALAFSLHRSSQHLPDDRTITGTSRRNDFTTACQLPYRNKNQVLRNRYF